MTGPLTIESRRALVTVLHGKQCVLCGNLQVVIPQALLVRLYPPDIRYLTVARRMRHSRRLAKRGQAAPLR